MDYCVIAFASTHGAIAAQKRLEGVAPFVIMPVLREISKGCGISLRFDPPYLDAVREALAGSGLAAEEYAFYGVTGHGGGLKAEPLP